MRVRVIGCSPAFPDPGGAHAGYVVSAPGAGTLLLDCGPGVLSRLRASGPFPVDAIAITHLHLDHWGDLVPWCWLASYGPAGPLPPAALRLPPGGRAALEAFAARFGLPGMFERAFAVDEYADGAPFELAGFHVEPLRVEHYGAPAWGFRVTGPDGRLLAYSGDSGPCDGLSGSPRTPTCCSARRPWPRTRSSGRRAATCARARPSRSGRGAPCSSTGPASCRRRPTPSGRARAPSSRCERGYVAAVGSPAGRQTAPERSSTEARRATTIQRCAAL
ncbi:MAG: MBL fold metallo-hydrolase [Thermoleophilia bacterium]